MWWRSRAKRTAGREKPIAINESIGFCREPLLREIVIRSRSKEERRGEKERRGREEEEEKEARGREEKRRGKDLSVIKYVYRKRVLHDVQIANWGEK